MLLSSTSSAPISPTSTGPAAHRPASSSPRTVVLLCGGAIGALALSACSEGDHYGDPERSPATESADALAEDRGALVTLAEFSGSYDAETGEWTLETVPVEPWAAPADALSPETLRTVPQALWCQLDVGGGPDKVVLRTVTGSIGRTLTQCGVPVNPITASFGAYCATVSMTSGFAQVLRRPMAEITSVTSGYEGYRYIETNGIIGVDPGTLGGPNPPSELLGLFGYPNLGQGQEARSVWAFHNPGGSFSFGGRIVAEATEVCNGLDDDCDGRVDEQARCSAIGDACTSHFDCQSGNCGSGGTCAASLCADGIRNASESDVDCGGTCDPCELGDACTVGADCGSGHCRGTTCVANRHPNVGELVITEVMVDGGAGTEYQDLEWFEFTNVSSETLDLQGCMVTDGEGSFTIGAATIAPGAYRVFAHSLVPVSGDGGAHDAEWAAHRAALPAGTIEYSTIGLANSADELEIRCPNNGGPLRVIDDIAWTTTAPDKATLQLHPASITAAANNVAANLCPGTTAYRATYGGTPGAPNTTCDVTVAACTLIGPPTADVPTGGTAAFTARVRVPGVTDRSVGTDPPAGRMLGQVGRGPRGTNPATSTLWTWSSANPDYTWNDAGAPGFDRYVGQFPVAAAAGTQLDVAFRWSGNNGGTWVNCSGLSRLGVTGPVGRPSVAGELVITEIMANPSGTESTGEWFEIVNASASPLDLDGCRVSESVGTGVYTINGTTVLQPGAYGVFALDPAATNGPGVPVIVQYNSIALGNSGDGLTIACPDGSGGFTTIDTAAYTSTVDGVALQVDPSARNAIDNDTAGHWCSAPVGTTFGSLGQRGTPGSANPACYTLDFCRTHAPTDLTNVGAGTTQTVFGRNYIVGLTPNTPATDTSPLVRAQLGYGTAGSDPATWTTWTNASANPSYTTGSPGHEPNNDEYVASFAVPATGGPWNVAYRFSANRGTSWTYCDRNMTGSGGADGSADGYQHANSVQMSRLTPVSIGWCVTQAPKNITLQHAGEAVDVYGRVLVAGLTEPAGLQPHPGLIAQHGYGPDGAHPSTWTTWANATGNPACSGCGDNDEYAVTFTLPSKNGGPYDHAFRFSGDGGATWSYCDRTDNVWTTGDAPVLDPNNWWPSYCHIQYPDDFSGTTGSGLTAYGRVFAWIDQDGTPGISCGAATPSECLTARTTGVDVSQDLIAEFGWGSNNDPRTWTNWVAGGPNFGWNDALEPNNDEYQTTITLPAVGSYNTAYRFSGDGGLLWTYCGRSGVWSAPGDALGTLTSTPNLASLPYLETFTEQIGKGAVGPGPSVDTSGVAWAIEVGFANLLDVGDWWRVVDRAGNAVFEGRDLNGLAGWSAPPVDISTATAVQASIEVGSSGSFGTFWETFQVAVRVDGGAPFYLINATSTGFPTQTITVNNIRGSQLEFSVLAGNDASTDSHWFDNVSVSAYTPPTGPCLRISQYVEGSGNRKGLELWNCGSTAVDLSQYRLRHHNCSPSACNTTLRVETLSGTLAPNAVHTRCNAGWNTAPALTPPCDSIGPVSVFEFNGNDAITLRRVSDDSIVDAVGRVGDPVTFAQDTTLSRRDCTPNDGSVHQVSDWVASGTDDTTGWGVAPWCFAGP